MNTLGYFRGYLQKAAGPAFSGSAPKPIAGITATKGVSKAGITAAKTAKPATQSLSKPPAMSGIASAKKIASPPITPTKPTPAARISGAGRPVPAVARPPVFTGSRPAVNNVRQAPISGIDNRVLRKTVR